MYAFMDQSKQQRKKKAASISKLKTIKRIAKKKIQRSSKMTTDRSQEVLVLLYDENDDADQFDESHIVATLTFIIIIITIMISVIFTLIYTWHARRKQKMKEAMNDKEVKIEKG
uniref:Uncharacterized protein n=1 Tax=Onchocerca volvulus TaxID=6282 RepID=A0A8R1TQ26_ONCVO